ncbi:MAG: hypothetical protein AAGH78_04125 [Cyanobacteria bacterium P01_H01_bin.58]
MYKNQQKDLLGSFVIAAMGAGIITTFAVSQGQSPWLAMGITLFAAGAAVAFEKFT